MKRALVLLLVLAVLLSSCMLPRPDLPAVTPAPPADPMTAPWDDLSVYRPGLVPSAQPVLERLTAASVYRLEIVIETGLTRVSGKEQVHYTNTETVALADVRFRLFPNILGGEMHVPEVLVDGQPITPSYSLDDSLLTVPLTSPLEPGASTDFTLNYTLQVPETVELNYGVLAYAQDVLALAHSYPMIPVFNEEGWNAEIPPQSGDVTFADMAFFTVRVSAPKDATLVTVGREISRTESGGKQVVTYAAGPVRDFYLAASPKYQLFTGQTGDTTVSFYAPRAQQAGARAALDAAVSALKDYGQRYAPFPYTELDFVETPTLALGIEYPGVIAITDRIIAPGDDFLEGTVAHETAHQWFYNLVGSDQLDQPWLDESLAQFATLQYFTDEYGQAGADGFRDSLEGRWSRVDHAAIPIGLPVSDYSDVEYGAIVYGRGPLFFDALEQKMGASAFDAFMQDYVTTYSWGIATPDGLKTLAEKHCSCDLTPIFDEWVNP